jgi:hypothetical protein
MVWSSKLGWTALNITLVELLVVTAIIGALAALLSPPGKRRPVTSQWVGLLESTPPGITKWGAERSVTCG